jgi:hypothetical protein
MSQHDRLDQEGGTTAPERTMELTDREREVFENLTDKWLRPMDVGGRDRSWHSGALASLYRKGLIERRGVSSYQYRNPGYVAPPPYDFENSKVGKLRREHKRLLGFARLLASYGCAGAPACEPPAMDVATGKTDGGLCGPCEAGEWLRENGYE